MISAQTSDGKKRLFLRGIRTPAGNRAIARASILTDGGDVVFWDRATEIESALSVSVSDPVVSGGRAGALPVRVSTYQTTANPAGGRPPYIYAWTRNDGPLDQWSIASPSAATTSFAFDGVETQTSETATFKITVTDAVGAVGTALVSATVTNYGDPRGPSNFPIQ